MRGKRQLLRNFSAKVGLTDWRWRTLRPGLYCFNYHRIGEPEQCEYSRMVFTCTAARFREHVALIKDRFELINLDRLGRLLGGETPPSRPLALITFDDGYIDNYSIAYPILKEYDASAVFFIPTEYVGDERVGWWDEIPWILRNTTVERLRLPGHGVDHDLNDTPIEETILDVIRRVVRRRDVSKSEQTREIREACGSSEPAPGTRFQLFMEWHQLKAMLAGGMDIGSHTHSHEILSNLDEGSQTRELEQSKAILEAQLGDNIDSVAYPIGTWSAYTPETCRIARSLGYRMGFNYEGGISPFPIEDRYQIGRLCPKVDEGGSPATLKSRICFPWL